MPHYPKPEEGSWTEHFPKLGTGPISYEDSISPEHYELERQAIFERTWLNVGRVEQLPKVGSYFTKELDAAARRSSWCAADDRSAPSTTSAAIAGTSSSGRTTPARRPAASAASSPASTTAGATRSRATSPSCSRRTEFFDLDKADYGLAPVHLDVWEGFIFVNLDATDTTPLARLPRRARRGASRATRSAR